MNAIVKHEIFLFFQTGGAESGSGGSGGSGMECLQLRSPPPGPGHFQYLISEQAKSLVALQVSCTTIILVLTNSCYEQC